MRYIYVGLAAFLILFAMADIAHSGACCNEDTMDPGDEDATCFCCCSHVTIERSELAADIADRPAFAFYEPSDPFCFPIHIYPPPRSF